MITMSVLLLIATPPASPQSKSANSADESATKVVCRSEQEVDSRIPKRICRTQAEWSELSKQTQEDLANSRNDRTIVRN